MEITFTNLLYLLLLFLPSLYFFYSGKDKYALWLLLLASAMVRLVMIQLDPFLHDWDERFHAVVAKNMMQYPFQPMIRLHAILPYDVNQWCCNYIWVHKQPLFLWQMALSMKLFGVNTFALRLPNVLMGTFMVFTLYDTAKIWTNQIKIAYMTALLFAVGYYNLELAAGAMALDHNDTMMGGYVMASIWAFSRYTSTEQRKWAIWVGIFAGCAVLTKWLTGLLVFGGWGIWLLLDTPNRTKGRAWLDLLLGAITCAIVFLPWQWYIRTAFPAESAASYAHNVKHIFEDLGHPGDQWTHALFMGIAYSGKYFLLLMYIGFILSWQQPINRKLSVAMAAMFTVVYVFFSYFVGTKMPGLTFPVAGIGFIWIAIAAFKIFEILTNWLPSYYAPVKFTLSFLLLLSLMGYSLEPDQMALARQPDNVERNKEIENTRVYQSLNQYVAPDEVILNCKNFEDTELRFWQPNNAYHWCPAENQIDSLYSNGYKLSAFKSHNDQALPAYMQNNPKVKIIDLMLK